MNFMPVLIQKLKINKEIGDHNSKDLTTYLNWHPNRRTRENQLKNQIIKRINIVICILPITPMKITNLEQVLLWGVSLSGRWESRKKTSWSSEAMMIHKKTDKDKHVLWCEMRETKTLREPNMYYCFCQ